MFRRSGRRFPFALAALLLGVAAQAAGIPIGASWHLQLDGKLKTPNRQLYDIDLYDTPAATIANLKAAGRTVICYFSAGTFEDWRPDAAGFPEATLGKPLADWPGERWLDIRHDAIRQIMQDRIALARQKGCDGVDPDNVDGYSNDTGLPLAAADQLAYNRFLADSAHAQGLLVGLKNAVALVPDLVGKFDFAINESCYHYRECGAYQNFIAHGKAVFIAEYRQQANGAWCLDAARNRFSLQYFRRGLNSVGTPCG